MISTSKQIDVFLRFALPWGGPWLVVSTMAISAICGCGGNSNGRPNDPAEPSGELNDSSFVAGSPDNQRQIDLTEGPVRLKGSLELTDQNTMELEAILIVHKAEQPIAEYHYRQQMDVNNSNGIPLYGLGDSRHMYSLLPKNGLTWRSLFTGEGATDPSSQLQLLRAEGAGEEQ